jgi:hypothetical protein
MTRLIKSLFEYLFGTTTPPERPAEPFEHVHVERRGRKLEVS